MPRELVAVAVRTPALRAYVDQPLQPNEIRVTSQFGAPKHGTELHGYRADGATGHAYWDPALKLMMPAGPDHPPAQQFPRTLGNIAVGVVSEVGSEVEGVKVGEMVAGYGPLRETQRWVWGSTSTYPGVRTLPEGMTWQSAVCLDPATVALGGIRDGQVRVGDRVAIFGLGAIGLMAVQLARAAGAAFVVAVDPIAGRRDVASQTGADLTIDPTTSDAGLAIRQATGGMGADVSVETSGSAQALHQAVRGVAFGGMVAITAWYTEFRGGVDLGQEAHLNRPTFVFTRAESEPHRDHPRWNNRRLADAAWNLLAGGQLDGAPIVQPIVPFDEVVDAYRAIDEHPERSVKLGVRFGNSER
ncbi:MAG TPA: zinc-binding alcohol dehydrogenase [Chloroflexota bacterium]|nr:zinc-binding alcohol dehydrogenase [Chloroflexota bacterium]